MTNTFVTQLLDQLGGYPRLKAFIGAYDFVSSEQTLTFKFKGSSRFNCCTISLNSLDLYDLSFQKITRRNGIPELVESATVQVKNVYCDQLVPTFTQQTGLYLFFTEKEEAAHLARFGS
ncbi:hypothetical protein [Gloeothece verrucosa]|uniref:Uncharacterized protein n=1 Tax=Gloeothece verrucosa (strain PCC 7822) TaxID=497965 RepID=E0UN44_GLOV7|nr:hypothetical protein [Gloeothece verrucosa]ADN18374.1 hypothetical protein Cyan7822_6622 [Gloeothece verrucosa PCC 7822]